LRSHNKMVSKSLPHYTTKARIKLHTAFRRKQQPDINQRWAKMAPEWPKTGPKMGQDGPKMGQDDPKMG
jgi:hypothetical protein